MSEGVELEQGLRRSCSQPASCYQVELASGREPEPLWEAPLPWHGYRVPCGLPPNPALLSQGLCLQVLGMDSELALSALSLLSVGGSREF